MRSDWQYVTSLEKLQRCVILPLTVISRYNLKRRVAALPPLSSEIFAQKVLNAQATSSAAAAKASFEKICTACSKSYYSENAYQNHLGSQKHRLRLAAVQNGEVPAVDEETNSVISSTISLGEPIATTSQDAVDPKAEVDFSKVVQDMKQTSLEGPGKVEPTDSGPSRPHQSTKKDSTEHSSSRSTDKSTIQVSSMNAQNNKLSLRNKCLFCSYDSPSLKLNIMHMTKFHGMFIPETTYLVNTEGLVEYLYQKINQDHECLYCHKLKGSATGVQTHMRDKGHCMIAFESEEEMIEVGQFYDFSSTYSDPESEEDAVMEDSDGPVEGNASSRFRRDRKDEVMEAGEGDGDGWETDSSASSLDSDDLTAVPIDHDHAFQRLSLHRHHSHTDPRPHRTFDGFHSHAHSHHAAFHSDYELHLPSGRTAGHRSLSRYYRQNLHKYPTPEERSSRRLLTDGSTNAENGPNRQAITRANGGSGMLGVTDAKKREVQGAQKRERRRAQRARQQYQWGVDKRGNSQKHFRDPLLQ